MSVLGTEATVKREYTRALDPRIRQDCAVTLVGSPRLAELAEAELKGEPVSDDDIAAEIAPCFVEADGERTDTVVLACTHYPLLLQRLRKLAPWPVNFIDPAPAIARRVVDLLGAPTPGAAAAGPFGSFSPPAGARPRALRPALGRFGLAEPLAVFDTPRYIPLKTGHLAGLSARAVFRDPRFCKFSQRFLRFGCKTCRFRQVRDKGGRDPQT